MEVIYSALCNYNGAQGKLCVIVMQLYTEVFWIVIVLDPIYLKSVYNKVKHKEIIVFFTSYRNLFSSEAHKIKNCYKL